jgi:pimeloyl-ACP methyl ester carboxylesterase
LGALYCLAFALEHPDGVAALVLSAPLLEPRFVRPEAPGGLFKMLKKLGPTSAGRIGRKSEELASDELVHDVITLRAIEQAEEAARSYGGRGPSLSMPTLVLQGNRDSTLAGPRIETRSADLSRGDEMLGWLDSKIPR